MNKFIEYLNSLNNASGSNENALAEAQLLNEYYEKIVVDRKISDYLYELLFENEESTAVVITGHAGDGKTSILIQLLEKMGYFENGKFPLKEYDVVEDYFLYIKDMSELNECKQEEMFCEFMKSPTINRSALLISNTGPLINTTKRMLNKTYSGLSEIERDEKIEKFEVELLSKIDSVESGNIDINIESEMLSFKVINIAKIDNSYFAEKLLEKFIEESLWEPCNKCECSNKCPAFINYCVVRDSKYRVVELIERLYFWLEDNQQRLTIRQMLSHLSYAITGNLNCTQIINKYEKDKDLLFNYNFANLFFGYIGTKRDKASYNIKAIRSLNELAFEEKALQEDYKLFVKEDYTMFDKSISSILENTLISNYDKLGIHNKESILMRRSFRRFYILLSKTDEKEFDNLISQIFSEMFLSYYTLVTEKKLKSKKTCNEVRDVIFKGLFKHFTGVHSCDEDELYLTLKKNNNSFQNVQLILGCVKKNELKIEPIKVSNNIEDTKKINKVIIKFKNSMFELSYNTLEYLNDIRKGKVFTKINPSFTFDLTRLKSLLISEYGKGSQSDDETMKVLIISQNSIKQIELGIDENQLVEV